MLKLSVMATTIDYTGLDVAFKHRPVVIAGCVVCLVTDSVLEVQNLLYCLGNAHHSLKEYIGMHSM